MFTFVLFSCEKDLRIFLRRGKGQKNKRKIFSFPLGHPSHRTSFYSHRRMPTPNTRRTTRSASQKAKSAIANIYRPTAGKTKVREVISIEHIPPERSLNDHINERLVNLPKSSEEIQNLKPNDSDNSSDTEFKSVLELNISLEEKTLENSVCINNESETTFNNIYSSSTMAMDQNQLNELINQISTKVSSELDNKIDEALTKKLGNSKNSRSRTSSVRIGNKESELEEEIQVADEDVTTNDVRHETRFERQLSEVSKLSARRFLELHPWSSMISWVNPLDQQLTQLSQLTNADIIQCITRFTALNLEKEENVRKKLLNYAISKAGTAENDRTLKALVINIDNGVQIKTPLTISDIDNLWNTLQIEKLTRPTSVGHYSFRNQNSKNSTSKKFVSKSYCYDFNKPEGCARKVCHFQHKCQKCDSPDHGKHKCPKE